MSNILRLTVLVLMCVATACTEVIDVNLQNTDPHLTIEASIDWEKGTQGNEQFVKLSTSTPYFDTTTNTTVTDATVKVTNDTNSEEFTFVHQSNGLYKTSSFVPIVNQSYTLEVIYKEETYSATESLVPVTDITNIYQSKENGFDEELLEVNIVFTDPEDEENYYLFKFIEPESGNLPELEFDNDEFVNGNEIEWYYEKVGEDEQEEGFQPGDIINFEMWGISKTYSNYMSILIDQSEGSGGPFGTTPVPLKGNCVNKTTASNYANGYFRVTQVIRESYTFE